MKATTRRSSANTSSSETLLGIDLHAERNAVEHRQHHAGDRSAPGTSTPSASRMPSTIAVARLVEDRLQRGADLRLLVRHLEREDLEQLVDPRPLLEHGAHAGQGAIEPPSGSPPWRAA